MLGIAGIVSGYQILRTLRMTSFLKTKKPNTSVISLGLVLPHKPGLIPEPFSNRTHPALLLESEGLKTKKAHISVRLFVILLGLAQSHKPGLIPEPFSNRTRPALLFEPQRLKIKNPLTFVRGFACDPAGIRTQDHYIKSVMLYQLSYGIYFVKTFNRFL